jgi:hypothetical protein
MSTQQHVLVGEVGLARGTYGPAIRWSEPTDCAGVDAFLAEVVAGRERDLFTRDDDAMVLRTADQYLVVERHGRRPQSLARFAVAEMVSS